MWGQRLQVKIHDCKTNATILTFILFANCLLLFPFAPSPWPFPVPCSGTNPGCQTPRTKAMAPAAHTGVAGWVGAAALDLEQEPCLQPLHCFCLTRGTCSAAVGFCRTWASTTQQRWGVWCWCVIQCETSGGSVASNAEKLAKRGRFSLDMQTAIDMP